MLSMVFVAIGAIAGLAAAGPSGRVPVPIGAVCGLVVTNAIVAMGRPHLGPSPN